MSAVNTYSRVQIRVSAVHTLSVSFVLRLGFLPVYSSRQPAARCVVTASSKKIDIRKQGLESIKDDVVKANLMGISRKMDKKGWVDAQGRKGKVPPPLPLPS